MSKVLTIERSKWRRGGTNSAEEMERLGETNLLNEKGLMCCLGFDAIACGISPAHILNKPNPAGVIESYKDSVPNGYAQARLSDDISMWHTEAVSDAIRANDAFGIPDDVREQRVREALLRLGYSDVIFID
jgi:hypothetical protein